MNQPTESIINELISGYDQYQCKDDPLKGIVCEQIDADEQALDFKWKNALWSVFATSLLSLLQSFSAFLICFSMVPFTKGDVNSLRF